MSYKDLNEFIKILEENGELVRVKVPVSPYLEITEIVDRVSKKYGKAILFEQVEGSSYPVLINTFGTYERMSLSLGVSSLDEIGEEIEEYLNVERYTSFSSILSFLPKLIRLLCCFPIRKRFAIKKPLCQQVIEKELDLSTIPVLKCWPLDGGRFFTLPLVFTKYPNSKNQNVGMYRMQILDKKTTAMHWHKHKDGAGLYEAYRKIGKKMPVSVAVGSSPSVIYSATAPLPPKLDEMMLAGFLNKRPIKMVKSITNDIYIPSDSQFVIEGYVDTEEELVWEGPFGDHTGYYSLADWYPKFHVTCITHRKHPIYPATVVGKPPMEDCYMAKATERIFLPILKFQMPQIIDINLPLEGVFHNCAVLSVREDYKGAARTVMNFIWGMGQMRYTKMLITINEKINPYDLTAVSKELLKNVNFQEDIIISKGPLDALDHSSNQAYYGTRIGIDAAGIEQNVTDGTLQEIYIASVYKKYPFDGRKLAKELLKTRNEKIIVIVDDFVKKEDKKEVLWRVFNNIDGERDFIIEENRLAIDATKKWKEEGLRRPWPEDIVMSEDIKSLVDRRWHEYGITF